MHVLFVCTGNLCRSPMAEALLRHILASRGCEGIEVSSAGTWAIAGTSATEDAVVTMERRGIDLLDHRSRPLDREEVERADVVVAMTSVHRREILELVPEAEGKTFLLKELAELGPTPSTGEREPRERLAELLGARRPEWRRALDVDDPIGLPLAAYDRCAGELEAGIAALVEILCPPAARSS